MTEPPSYCSKNYDVENVHFGRGWWMFRTPTGWRDLPDAMQDTCERIIELGGHGARKNYKEEGKEVDVVFDFETMNMKRMDTGQTFPLRRVFLCMPKIM